MKLLKKEPELYGLWRKGNEDCRSVKAESVELNGKVTSKPETIEKMVALMAAGGNLADVEAYKKGVFAREEESTTGIGEGIAIPHAKTAAVKAPDLQLWS